MRISPAVIWKAMAKWPTPLPPDLLRDGPRACSFSQHALSVGADIEAPPQLAVGKGFDNPIAALFQHDRFFQKQPELHGVAGVAPLALPGLGFRKHLHAG